MPETIQLTSVSDLDLKDFKDQEKGTLKDGSIKLGKSTYTVKFIDGKVSVSRNFHFFNLFRANAKNALRDAFNEKMYNNTTGKNEALYTNTFKALEKNFKRDGSKSMMLFGMGGQTNLNKQGLEALEQFKRIQVPSEVNEFQVGNEIPGFKEREKGFIDPNLPNTVQSTKFEELFGIAGLHKDDMKRDLIGSLTRLSDPAFVANRLNQISDRKVDSKLIEDWLVFLQKNANRVNIFRMLKQAISDKQDMKLPKKNLVGWAAMMRKHTIKETLTSFLQKNMAGNLTVTKKVAYCLHYFLNKLDESDPVDLLKLELAKKVGLNEQEQEIFMNSLIRAVQREVMKLGLEFCREKNIPVLFQWTDSEGKTVSSKELKTQLWSPDYFEDKRPKFSPILHTAMRHALRMQKASGNKLKLVQVNGAAPD